MTRARLLKPSEVAVRLAVSRSWVYAAAADGRLPCLRLGAADGPLRFREEDLDSWIAEAGCEQGTRPSRPVRASRSSRSSLQRESG